MIINSDKKINNIKLFKYQSEQRTQFEELDGSTVCALGARSRKLSNVLNGQA
jgi:hypothetical protein